MSCAFLPAAPVALPATASRRHLTRDSSRARSPRHGQCLHMASPTTTDEQTLRPAWAGGGPLTTAVNVLLGFKPLYKIIVKQAKMTMVKTALQRGVPWNEMQDKLAKSGVQGTYDDFVDPNMQYPQYYIAPFHGYPEGNLCWEAAFEVEPATLAMGLRTFKDQPDLSPADALSKIRNPVFAILEEHCPEVLCAGVTDVLDIGCSVGISTEALREYLLKNRPADAKPLNITGLDLSPYFLAVAAHRSKQFGGDDIRWVHGAAEALPYPDASMDVISVQFVIHELPSDVTRKMVREALRVLRPGGVVFLVDNDPRSEVIRNLPGPIFTMMKSTEPWSDEYYMLDMSSVVQDAGLELLYHGASDHRHRTIIGRRPATM